MIGQQRYIEVPLADELFTCHQGEFRSTHKEGGSIYETYSNTIQGTLDDPEVEKALVADFEKYLRYLRAKLPVEGKPDLFWRFRIGHHISLEFVRERGSNLVQLRTRLVVPDLTVKKDG